MRYCAREDLTPWVDPSSFGATAVQMALEAASDYLDRATGDQFWRESGVQKRFDGEGKGLLLVQPSLWAVQKVEIWDDGSGTFDESLLVDEFNFDKNFLQLRTSTMRRPRFPIGTDTVRITGDWGWSPVPPLIRLACARITSVLLTGHSAESVSSESLGGYSVSYSGDKGTDLSIAAIVDMFKLQRILGGRVRGRRVQDFDDTCPRKWSFISEDY